VTDDVANCSPRIPIANFPQISIAAAASAHDRMIGQVSLPHCRFQACRYLGRLINRAAGRLNRFRGIEWGGALNISCVELCAAGVRTILVFRFLSLLTKVTVEIDAPKGSNSPLSLKNTFLIIRQTPLHLHSPRTRCVRSRPCRACLFLCRLLPPLKRTVQRLLRSQPGRHRRL